MPLLSRHHPGTPSESQALLRTRRLRRMPRSAIRISTNAVAGVFVFPCHTRSCRSAAETKPLVATRCLPFLHPCKSPDINHQVSFPRPVSGDLLFPSRSNEKHQVVPRFRPSGVFPVKGACFAHVVRVGYRTSFEEVFTHGLM